MIGIVTISFNQGQFLEEALNSVLDNRRTADLKYVVVDAGSSDGSRDLLSQYSDRIDILIQEPDKGPADGLNKGFSHCRDCSILGYINADDRLRPGALGWVQDFFDTHPDIDVLLGAIGIIDQQGRVGRRARVSDKFDVRRYAVGACNVFQQGTFFRREIYDRAGGFNIDNRTCWDGELVVDFALAGAAFLSTHKILGDFRIYPASITGSSRLAEAYRADKARIARRIETAGFVLPTSLGRKIQHYTHRLSPVRHLKYLLAS
jgi:glycosyltransferase involved in cell wall biosynthesis